MTSGNWKRTALPTFFFDLLGKISLSRTEGKRRIELSSARLSGCILVCGLCESASVFCPPTVGFGLGFEKFLLEMQRYFIRNDEWNPQVRNCFKPDYLKQFDNMRCFQILHFESCFYNKTWRERERERERKKQKLRVCFLIKLKKQKVPQPNKFRLRHFTLTLTNRLVWSNQTSLKVRSQLPEE